MSHFAAKGKGLLLLFARDAIDWRTILQPLTSCVHVCMCTRDVNVTCCLERVFRLLA